MCKLYVLLFVYIVYMFLVRFEVVVEEVIIRVCGEFYDIIVG